MALLSQLIVRFGADIADFTSDMNRAARISEQKSKQMRDALTKSAQVIGTAAVAAGAASAKMISDFTEDADKYSKLVDRLGGSTEAWSELAFVAERSGVQFNQLSMGLQRMTRRLGEAASMGRGEAKPALDLLGLSAADLLKLPIDKQFEAIAEELSKIPDESTRAALAMKFFDSEGVGLVQTMGKGSAGIRELRQEAAQLGVTISTEAAAEAVRFKDRVTDLSAATTGFSRSLAQEVVPILADLATQMVKTGDGSNFAAKAGQFLSNVIRVVVAGAIVLKNAFEAASHVLVAFGTIVVETFGALVSPVTRFTEAISIAFHELSEGNFRAAAGAFKDIAGNVVQDFQDAGVAIGNVVKDQMGEAFGDLTEGVTNANNVILGLADTSRDEAVPALIETGEELSRLTQNQIAVAAGFKGVDDVLSEVVVTAKRQAIPTFKEVKEEATGMAAVMEQAWQNLDTTFQNVWTNFFETGKLSLSSIKDLFLQTLAQMAHQALTRPIVMQIGAAIGLSGASGSAFAGQDGLLGGLAEKIGGFFSDWNLADAGIGALIGNTLFDSIGGTLGGAGGAWAGSLFGGIVGGPVGAWIGKILGGALGGLLGDLFGGLFKSDPLPALQIAGMGPGVQGKIGGYGNMRRNFDTAFGTFQITNAQDGAQEAVEDVIRAMTDFHEAMASFMTPAQLETVKQNFAEFGHEWTNDAITIENVISQQFTQLLNHFEFLTAGVKDYVNSFTGLEQRTEAFARYVKAFNAMSIALAEYARSDIRSLVQVEMDTRSSAQRLADFGVELRTAIDGFDRTPEAFDRITAAISNRYQAEIEYIRAIDSLIESIGASIERQRASLRGQLGLDAARTPEQVLADAKRAMAGLSRAGSPEEIASIVSNVQALLDAAVRNAPEELAKGAFGLTRDEVIGQALGILDALESSATSRANVLRENAVAEAIALREEAAAFAAEQHIDLEAIQTSTDATTTAINDQTVVISQGNDSITEKLDRLIGLMSDQKSGFDDVVVRGVS